LNSFLTNLAAVGRRTDILERVESPLPAAITLTRTASQSIPGTSATITWQVETRNRGFNWSGTTITIPTDGFYQFYLFGQVNTNQINFFDIVTTGSLYVIQSVRAPITNATATYYFTTGTTFTIVITNSAAGLTLNQNVRIDIIQLTGAV
jgi:hypothetical protein